MRERERQGEREREGGGERYHNITWYLEAKY
jgi:hypothetical protein